MTFEDGAPKAESPDEGVAKADDPEEVKEPNQSVENNTEQVDTEQVLKEGSTFLKDPYQRRDHETQDDSKDSNSQEEEDEDEQMAADDR